ncbi:MAG TPA: DUF6519 domain-containing protein [Thermoanaerobaculia bacterium]
MHGDFSLNPLTYRDRVTRVLYQMGRVQLDSDANEQTESTLRFLRGLAQDVIGYHGGADDAFRIAPDDLKNPADKLRIQWGEYYVDGIRCVNMPDAGFWEIMADPEQIKNGKLPSGPLISEHADSYLTPDLRNAKESQLVYLAVWERHISSSENDAIREVALNGPDTASRAVVVWQIRIAPSKDIFDAAQQLRKILDLPMPGEQRPAGAMKLDPVYLALNLRFRSRARLQASAKENQKMEACAISPEARYRGSENRLFRVEVHRGGTPDQATFKWSEDNGAIVYPVREIKGKQVYLESLGRDERTAIRKNDWVEVVDDKVTLTRQVNPLLKVIDVDRHRMTVTLSAEPANNAGSDKKLNPILRRWAEDARKIVEKTDPDLGESGVKVHFSSAAPPTVYDKLNPPIDAYRPGDYWLIPARIALGNVIWPGGPDKPDPLPPHGVEEHYAPLALWNMAAATATDKWEDYRWQFETLANPVTPLSKP